MDAREPGPHGIARARLADQGLLPGFGRQDDAAATVRWMGMMQAQDLGQASWALGVRQPGLGLSGVRDALSEGRIVRTWGARGTLMLVATDRVDALLDVTAARMGGRRGRSAPAAGHHGRRRVRHRTPGPAHGRRRGDARGTLRGVRGCRGRRPGPSAAYTCCSCCAPAGS
ncbi:DNA glycosylase AlkZ-like family protein [Zafaria sp. Z1313]|uniref:DNA glycosylase AlkZ-like family protein n=1 Tax=Zafaria sp. Z1313 TaxID=3423202 RepID=UPI003D302A02